MSEMMRVYVDTCVVSGLAKGDLHRSAIDALLRILEFRESGRVNLVTSSVMKDEIDRIPEEYRTPHQAIYLFLARIPVAATHRTDSGLTLLGVGGGRRADSLFKSLKALLPDEDDARHVFQAAKNGVEYFLTVDKRSIVRFREAVEKRCGVKPVDPEHMVQIIEDLS